MVIPDGRMTAALWCYQLSIFTAVLTVLSYPYISAIIAHERMKSFAYIAILDAILKLLLVYLLLVFDYDRLMLYATLYAGEKLLIRSVYNIYCIRNFDECRYQILFRKDILKEMASFAGWRMWSNFALVWYTQGLDWLLNVFFGPVANAARATAYYAQGAVGNVASNFQTAINPQITKTYASGQMSQTHQLIFRGTRLTFCLLLVICLPLIIEAPTILSLWLKEVPEGSAVFLRLMLVALMIQQCANVLVTAVAATGKIKKYELIIGGLMFSIVPIAYVVLKMGGAPWSIFVVYLCITATCFIANLFIILPLLGLSRKNYTIYALKRCAIVLIFSLIIPIVMYIVGGSGMLISFLNIILTVIGTCIFSFYFGLETNERRTIVNKVSSFIIKIRNDKTVK